MSGTQTSRLGQRPAGGIKEPVVAATTAGITLSGEQTIDGASVTSGDRVLVKDQADASENGIYVAATSAWSRAADFDDESEVVPGILVVDQNKDALYRVKFTGDFDPDTTDLSFENALSLQSPDGTLYEITVDNAGNLGTNAL